MHDFLVSDRPQEEIERSRRTINCTKRPIHAKSASFVLDVAAPALR